MPSEFHARHPAGTVLGRLETATVIRFWLVLAMGAATFLVAGCGGSGGPGAAPTTPTAPQLGDPLPDLEPDELAAFQRGKAIFEKRFKPSEGLGPFYNATSCVSCHSSPVTGGSARLYRNFYLAQAGDPAVSNAQSDLPGLPSVVIPAYGANGPHASATFTLQGGRRPIPHGGLNGGTVPVQVAQRNAIPVFGVGLFEFISDATIVANADPDDSDGDNISGRFNTDRGEIGRFGVKAQSSRIERFTRPPLQNQMGITTNPLSSPIVRIQQASGGDAPTTDGDGVPDPELDNTDLADLVAYTTLLAPHAKKPFTAAAQSGEARFRSLGCVKCHIESLPSSRGPVEAYTDLLLHDMGPALADNIAMGGPQPSTISGPTTHLEFRTQPLWGVSHHGPWLHDGRAETLLEAILLHGGEAQDIRDAFAALSASDQAEVIEFLEHL